MRKVRKVMTLVLTNSLQTSKEVRVRWCSLLYRLLITIRIELHEIVGSSIQCMRMSCGAWVLSVGATELARKAIVHCVISVDWCCVGIVHRTCRHLQTQRNLTGGPVCWGTGAAKASLPMPLPILRHNLALNASAMRCLSNEWQEGTYSFNKATFGFVVGVVHSSLNDIVGV